jgi:geranylgeranyl pyrophosphate synthase
MELSDGELLQLTNMQKTEISEIDYFKVIRKKTALLFAKQIQMFWVKTGMVTSEPWSHN